MTTEATVLLEAAFASYAEAPDAPEGYTRISKQITNHEGLHAEIYQQNGTKNYILSFRGTDKALNDISTDFNLGWPQYKESREQIQRVLHGLIESGGKIDITGHSLGGALAQFAAYDLIKGVESDKRAQITNQVSLTTWNALGGVWGLQRNGGYDPTAMDGFRASHYYHEDDLVARLGKGHVGGTMLRLNDPEGLVAGVVDAHMKEELSQSLNAGQITRSDPGYFVIADTSQIIAASLAMRLAKQQVDMGSAETIAPLLLSLPPTKTLLIKDIAILLGSALLQEMHVRKQTQHQAVQELSINLIRGGTLTAQMMIDGILNALEKSWSNAATRGPEFLAALRDDLLDLGRALIAAEASTQGNLSELHVWEREQRFANDLLTLLGAPPLQRSLPGTPDLAACEALLNARLQQVLPFTCPLVLDLGGDGLTTLPLAGSGVRFDLDADGVREACGWIGPGEALLVRDRNRDGRIDSGRELFGDHTLLANGTHAAHGFAALAELDGNGDGLVDGRDAAWSDLGLWRDSDSDGQLDGGEWLSLAAADIGALELAYRDGGGRDAQGNELRLSGHYRRSNGERRLLADVWLASEASQAAVMPAPLILTNATTRDPATSLPAPLRDLPDIRGIGRVAGLKQSLLADSSGRLAQCLQTWLAADSRSRQQLLPEILYRWAGVADRPATPVGGLADGRLLATLHAFSNDRFIAANWDVNSPTNLALLRDSFEHLCRWVGTLLSSRELLSPLWSQAIRVGPDGRPSVDGPSLDQALQDQLNRASSDDQLIAAGQALRSHVLVDAVLREALRERATQQAQPDRRLGLLLVPQRRQQTLEGGWHWSQEEAELIELAPGDHSVDAAGGDDVLIGSSGADRPRGGDGDDLILGGDGDDTIETSPGNDTICGGRGNDSISVGRGQGLIVFNPGDGQDRITTHKLFADDPYAGQNFGLRFNGSQAAETIRIRRIHQDLRITFQTSSDQLILTDYFLQPYPWHPTPTVNALSTISFADGRRWDYQKLMEQAVQGTSGNDDLQGCERDETISAGSGDDSLLGWGGRDLLDGGSGADILLASSGDNTLKGGSGNDTFSLTGGRNRILYNIGDGLETIYGNSYSAHNELILGPGIAPQDLRITRSQNDLLLTLPDPTAGIRLGDFLSRNACHQESSPIRMIRFDDGQIWSWQTLKDALLRGTPGDDQIIGFSNDDTIWGEAGQDALVGREGNDLLIGGSGNDTLDGDPGSDTLDGGEGDDVLVVRSIGGEDMLLGGSGRNLFRHSRGDAWLAANPDNLTGSSNTLELPLIAPEDLSLERHGHQLRIRYKNLGLLGFSTIKVDDFFRDFTVLNRWNPLQFLQFGSGTRWDARTLASRMPNAFMGSSADNKLSGRDSDDWLDGLEGHDSLQGLAGHDTLQGGSGNDTLIGGAGNDLLLGSDGVDTASWAGMATPVRVQLGLSGPQDSGAGFDTLIGIEALIGGSGADQLLGDDGANRLDGGDGDDWLDGGGGNDTLIGGNQLSGGDTASYGRASAAVVVNLSLTVAQNTAGAGSDLLSGVEHLIGSAHGDRLIGSSTANRLEGGGGNDTLQGGAGADSLTGGEAADLFVVATPAEAGIGSGSRDWILDFSPEDRLDLSGIDARSDQSGNQAFVWIGSAAFSGLGQLRYTRLSNGNGLLEGNCTGTLAADLQLELSGAPDLAAGAAVLL